MEKELWICVQIQNLQVQKETKFIVYDIETRKPTDLIANSSQWNIMITTMNVLQRHCPTGLSCNSTTRGTGQEFLLHATVIRLN